MYLLDRKIFLVQLYRYCVKATPKIIQLYMHYSTGTGTSSYGAVVQQSPGTSTYTVRRQLST
eukprot:SAG31_NODE_6720_length_1911_cov_2.739514_1_plen_62_part_00